jgi:hypothetical protein
MDIWFIFGVTAFGLLVTFLTVFLAIRSQRNRRDE